MQVHETTREERTRHVAQMGANFAIEDLHPQPDDVVLQQRYVDGHSALADMLEHAREFARKSAQPAA